MADRFFLVTDNFGTHVTQYTYGEVDEVFSPAQRDALNAGETITHGAAVWTDMVRATLMHRERVPVNAAKVACLKRRVFNRA